MEFESRFLRKTIVGSVIGFVPDMVFSLIAAWYIKEGIIWAIWIFLGLQALYITVWIFRSAFSWAYFQFIGRKAFSAKICDFLHANKFPPPKDWEKSAQSYLTSTMEDEEIDTNIRLKAAFELGSLSKLVRTQDLIRTEMAFEDAIEEYKRDLIRKGTVDTY